MNRPGENDPLRWKAASKNLSATRPELAPGASNAPAGLHCAAWGQFFGSVEVITYAACRFVVAGGPIFHSGGLTPQAEMLQRAAALRATLIENSNPILPVLGEVGLFVARKGVAA